MKNVAITIAFSKKVENVDYIKFSLVNGESILVDDCGQYSDTVIIRNKDGVISYPARVLLVQNLDLGNIPFRNQVARINGISDIQIYTDANGEENDVKFVKSVVFSILGEETALPNKFLPSSQKCVSV